MTQEEKNKFDALESLRLAAYTSFNDRRMYEWKISISIWSACSILIVGLIQPIEDAKIFPIPAIYINIIAPLLGIAIVIIHYLWSNWIFSANDIDKSMNDYFRDEMMFNPLNMQYSSEIYDKINSHKKIYINGKENNNVSNIKNHGSKISHRIQNCITIVLVITVVLLLVFRAN